MNDRYLQYELNDFLVDDAFVNWVLSEKDHDEWRFWLAINPDKSALVHEARTVISKLKFKEQNIGPEVKNQLWDRIEVSTASKEVQFKPRRRFIYGLLAAASIALLGILFIPGQKTFKSTDSDEFASLILPANSVVDLSPTSSLSYSVKKWNDKRAVMLKGNGHFKVSKGVPFEVITDNGSVQVLGTEFDVLSSENIFQVLVTEGKVNVSCDNYSEILTEGMGFYKNPKWVGSNKLTEKWKTNRIFFAFEDHELSDVVKSIEYYYGYSVNIDMVDGSTKLTGSFDTNDDIETSFRSIFWPLRINFNLENQVLTLSPQ